MSTPFEQQIGAAGDVNELEYVSALHQTTTQEVRRDASIRAEDIQRFLMSRYGIRVTEEEVTNTILQGLGGASEGDDVLDLMEVVAMLLIPTILKASRKEYLIDKNELGDDGEQEELSALEEAARPSSEPESKLETADDGLVPTPPGMLDFVLKMILHDVTGDRAPKLLTRDLIRRILKSLGEMSLASNDELIDEMFEAAAGENDKNGLVLDVETFAEALTYDIRLYDIRNETRLTTNFNDVYLTDESLREREEQMFANSTTSAEIVRQHRENRTIEERIKISNKLDRVNTVPFIDTTSGTYRSKGTLVLLWATLLVTFFAYMDFSELESDCTGSMYVYDSPWSENGEAIRCEIVYSVANWVLFFVRMSIFGVVCVYLGSIGNAVDSKQVWKPLFSSAVVFMIVTIPFVAVALDEEVSSDRKENRVLYFASIAFGLLTCCLSLGRAAELYFSEAQMEEFKSYFPTVNLPFFKNTVSEELSVKRATARKLSQMTKNALRINKLKDPDSILNTHYGQALKMYETETRNNDNTVVAGGFLWTWRKIFGQGEDFAREGIWVPARMISSNLAQYVVAFYIVFAGIFLAQYLEEEYDIELAKQAFGKYVDRAVGAAAVGAPQEDQLAYDTLGNVSSVFSHYLKEAETNGKIDLGCSGFSMSAEEFLSLHCSNLDSLPACEPDESVNYLCPLLDPSLNTTSSLALLNASGVGTSELENIVLAAAKQAANTGVDNLYPAEKYMVTIPVYTATIVAFLVALSLAITYIPSVTTTILRLRNGHIPTLRNKDFNRYRCAPDQVALLTPTLFWGSLFASIIVGAMIGVIVFFFLWQATRYYAQRTVAILCGLISVQIVRLSFVCTARCTLWTSFYRVKPGAANIIILALEWGNFALSAGYVLARSVRLLLAAATFIGRIDTPFLAHNVGRIGPLELDGYPIVHLKDVLTHEAHRHPYIEMLGTIYLHKLRYKNHFGKRAGSCWRLIFVYALMPWLHRYRIMARCEEPANMEKEGNDASDQLQFVSVRRISAYRGEESDKHASQAMTEAMWKMRVQAMHSADEFLKRRTAELEEEVERLRVSLAEARSLTNQDLEEEVERLNNALEAATRSNKGESDNDEGMNSQHETKAAAAAAAAAEEEEHLDIENETYGKKEGNAVDNDEFVSLPKKNAKF